MSDPAVGMAAILVGLTVGLAVWGAFAPVTLLPTEMAADEILNVQGSLDSGQRGVFNRFFRPMLRNFMPQTPMSMQLKARHNGKIAELLVRSGNPWGLQPEEYYALRFVTALVGLISAAYGAPLPIRQVRTGGATGPVFGETTTKGKSMVKVRRAFFAHRKHDERGSAEFAAALMVVPVMFVLIIGCVEIGFYVQTRMRVENIARDAARQVANDGGNYNVRTTRTLGHEIDDLALDTLLTGDRCKLSHCGDDLATIRCNEVAPATGNTYWSNEVLNAGDTVTCQVEYDYKPLSGNLMTGPLGLGIGNILKPFTVRESARAETGTAG
jgi:TadE-like protein